MESTDFRRKSQQILVWLETAEQRLVTRVNRALKGAGLPFSQFVVLNHLASLPGEGWTVTGLAAVLETGQPGVSKILRRLAAKGHVRIDTDPGDRRVRRHRLTEGGKAAHREAFRRVAPQITEIFSGWRDGDIDALHGLLYKLKSSLRD